MLSSKEIQEYYKALLEKDTNYDGVFYVGIKTTGVFCRSICPARKPKFQNCEFFRTAEEALLASYRPCKRCQPLSSPNQVPEVVRKLIEAVEAHPDKRWKEQDFAKLSTNAAQASRLFKKRFGMTFVAYARARRMGIGLKEIREKRSIIDTQLHTGYESGSGFRDAFSKIMGAPPVKAGKIHLLKADWIDTPLGPMVAIADQNALYLLEFVDRRGLEREIEKLRIKTGSAIVPGKAAPITQIEKELNLYFHGEFKAFKTPLHMIGSTFQKQVWNELQRIPIGKTCSYKDIARAIKKPPAVRAVARANGANQFAIIIPCHRVINTSGDLGGYGGGVARKKWLLAHEKSMKKDEQ
ncbi:MAG TPA: trifunctional transcriptional activator/DNA repair protein Ada/methylated-DNA--[protein]-cysteine S-methyltransferase [Rhabdochlamydiaceae bacterium]|nr:trifunctional transcriptional activator/DNA repair protein Ada/methylated-DNA--[protein]-cysteine S-methyltransferase [Rhabdochlamydiaceae bacterium]